MAKRTKFLHDNVLGAPQLATDASKAVFWQAAYQPSGTASVSGMITQNLRFPGQYFDVESWWNHNGFRNYIPDLGRFAEPDPLLVDGRTTSAMVSVIHPNSPVADPKAQSPRSLEMRELGGALRVRFDLQSAPAANPKRPGCKTAVLVFRAG